jgi:DNA primase
MGEDLERLKQRIPLLEYLQRHNWKPCRADSRQELVGLCPLHHETCPSFYVNIGLSQDPNSRAGPSPPE